jgi:exodeoxyribonuclease-3
MKTATWNVNSIRSRLERVLAWLEQSDVDILCLQELKTEEDKFPRADFDALGYHAAVFGQKTYNGVAIISKLEPANIRTGFGSGDSDVQSRLISAEIGGITVVCCYFPNGSVVGSEKWEYKLSWMSRLLNLLESDHSPADNLMLCGDTNIAIDDRDVENPDAWADSVLCHPEGRKALQSILSWGLRDVFREFHPEGHVYTWWDYRRLAFPRNDGLRIDHIFATNSLADRCIETTVDRDQRKGNKPSDHAPVTAAFTL